MADKDLVDLPDEFERLLRQELSVEPSPAFAPSVRAQVAELRRPASWMPWVLACAAAAAIAIAVWLPLRRERVDAPVQIVSTTPPVAVTPPPAVPTVITRVDPEPSRPAQPVVRAAVQPVRRVPPVSPAEPVVLIDRAQQTALATVFRMVDQGRLTAETFAKTTPQSMQPIAEQVVPIDLPPVAVSTMTSGGVLQDDNKRK